jgi:hypothetical protein
MLIYLPFESLQESITILSREDKKQAFQTSNFILKVLDSKRNAIHPGTVAFSTNRGVKLWEGWEYQLTLYRNIVGMFQGISPISLPWFRREDPEFLKNERLKVSHRSALLRKNEKFYGKYFNVAKDIPLFWPV